MIGTRIGIGVYTLQEASLYSCVSPQRLSRWVFGARNCSPVIKSLLASDRLLSFYDLVQAKAIDVARKEGISLQKIRQAIGVAQDEYSVEFPLARQHKLLYYDGELHIKLNGIFQVSGRRRHQMLSNEIVEPFAKDLHFDEEGLAFMWTPFSRFRRCIVLDPKRQFGQPLVEGTGYTADVLSTSFKAEGSHEAAAEAYNVEVDDIKIAVAYIKGLMEAA